METAILLANIGANSTVVAAGLLHDAVDDSSVTYEHISSSLGAGVSDLVEGVRVTCSLLTRFEFNFDIGIDRCNAYIWFNVSVEVSPNSLLNCYLSIAFTDYYFGNVDYSCEQVLKMIDFE